jgi:hypothetical protein
METDRSGTMYCDDEIHEKGNLVVLLDGGTKAVENWVQTVADKAQARLDWHYRGSLARVLHLGDEASRRRVEAAIKEMGEVENPKVVRCVDLMPSN